MMSRTFQIFSSGYNRDLLFLDELVVSIPYHTINHTIKWHCLHFASGNQSSSAGAGQATIA